MLLTLILTLSHYLTLSLFLTLTLFQSLIESLLTCWTTFVFISMLKSHSHTLTLSRSHSHTLSLSHSHTLSISHSITLDMLNNFCFHVYSQNSLFIAENCNGIFWDLITLACYFRCHRAGSHLKSTFPSQTPSSCWSNEKRPPHSSCFQASPSVVQSSPTVGLSWRCRDPHWEHLWPS